MNWTGGLSLRALFERYRPHLLPLGALLALAGVAYFSVFDPVLYMDDWDLVRKFVFGEMLVVDPARRRPFEDAVIWFLFHLLGVNPRALMVVIVGLILSCAGVIYLSFRDLFPRVNFLALPIAMLFIVYPVDTTKIWMTRVYQWVIFLFVLLGCRLLISFLRGGTRWKLVLALLLLIPLLGAYDGQLGLVLFLPLLIALGLPGATWPRRLWALTPLLGGAFLIFWRLFLQAKLLGYNDPYLNQATTDGIELIRRILTGFPVFAESWVKPFETILPEISVGKLLLILAGACGAAFLLGLSAVERAAAESWGKTERRQVWIALGGVFLLGLTVWAAGLVPAVVMGAPGLNLNGSSSRNHTYAILGGSIWLACLLAGAVVLAVPSRRLVAPLLTIAVIPLIVTGAGQQIWIQNESRLAWRQQQMFWKMAFLTLPDLENNATVVVSVCGEYPTRPFEHLPLTAEWEVNYGLKVLYDNPSLQGMLYFRDFTNGTLRETKFKPDGVSGYIIEFVPYDQMVIVDYNPANQVMRVVTDPRQEFGLPFEVNGYQPERFIRESPAADSVYRRLLH